MEIKICVANLSNYNNGNKRGHWFVLPTSISEFDAKVPENGNEGYIITDYEAPFRINEDDNIIYLNRVAESFNNNADNPVLNYVTEIIKAGFVDDLNGFINHINYFYFMEGDFYNLGYEHYEQLGKDENLKKYVNFEKIGRDLYLEKNIIKVSTGFIGYV